MTRDLPPPTPSPEADTLDALGVGLLVTDVRGRVRQASPRAREWLGGAASGPAGATIEGRSLFDMIEGLGPDAWAAALAAADVPPGADAAEAPARPPALRLRVPRPDGSTFTLEARWQRRVVDGEDRVVMALTSIADRVESEAVDLLQRDVLEAVALGKPLPGVLDLLCRRVESLAPEVSCSVLLVRDGRTVHPIAGPSLPPEYSAAIDGAPIGPVAGSCGTAAWRRQPVEVTDVLTDPLWAPYKAVIEPTGLRACWSTPILSSAGDVVATFALYYRTPRRASPFHRRMVEACVPLCRIALRHEEHRVEIERLVYVDPLTALPNRRLLTDRAGLALQFAQRTGTRGALLLLDIDRFHTANDSLGHAVGDQLLREIARRLQQQVGPADTVARLGGDEFGVLVPECQPMSAMHTAESLRHALALPVTIGGLSLSTTASIGISVFPDDGANYESVLKNAEVAMYEAKRGGGNAARFFTLGMNDKADERLRMESALRRALARQALEVHYQPKFRLDGGGCIGVEALARWTDPAFGQVSPDRFIPLAEESGLVNALDAWVLETACAQLARWRAQGVPVPSVAVNVSAVRFQHDDVPVHVGQVLARTGLPADALVLEVTERTMLGDSARTRDDLRALHEMGVTLSVDDFGTGYSSLGYLKRLPVGELKLDRSFVRDLETAADDRALAAAVVGIAHALGLRVVAEGVETDGQRDILTRLGCHAAQGFGYTPALPAAALARWFREDGRRWLREDQDAAAPGSGDNAGP